ncbi:hypothetical protein [Maricaulis sp.]|uniref:hypothetical protein n=1 Tax=Maricaulis sp. TaxID=1486257 RepID=UPI002B27C0BE|nr:hypothetical protein [Maricaulis sp.]
MSVLIFGLAIGAQILSSNDAPSPESFLRQAACAAAARMGNEPQSSDALLESALREAIKFYENEYRPEDLAYPFDNFDVDAAASFVVAEIFANGTATIQYMSVDEGLDRDGAATLALEHFQQLGCSEFLPDFE